MGASESSVLAGHFDDLAPVEGFKSSTHGYTMHRGKTKRATGGKQKNVLLFGGDSHSMKNLKYFSKTIRHPYLLHYLDTFSLESLLTTYIVFEEAVPLSTLVRDMCSQEVVHGMKSIINALTFIHDTCLCSYNNVLISSVFVTPSGQWKLGCLENMAKFSNSSWHAFAQSKIATHLLPPEDHEENTVPASFAYHRDIYMLGLLFKNELSIGLRDNSLLIDFARYVDAWLLHKDYKQRPKCSQIVRQPVFNSYYSSVVTFLHDFVMKNENQKQEFFKELNDNLYKLEPRLLLTRILPLILSNDHIIAEPSTQTVLQEIWCPSTVIRVQKKPLSGIMSETQFREQIIPQFIELLHSKSIHTRLLVLTYLKPLLPYIPKKELSKVVLPRLLTGLRDTNDEVVSMTFHALGDLVPYLGSIRVVGGQRRQIFLETRPRNITAPFAPANSHADTSYFAEEEEEIQLEETPSKEIKRVGDSNRKSSGVRIHMSPISEKTEELSISHEYEDSPLKEVFANNIDVNTPSKESRGDSEIPSQKEEIPPGVTYNAIYDTPNKYPTSPPPDKKEVQYCSKDSLSDDSDLVGNPGSANGPGSDLTNRKAPVLWGQDDSVEADDESPEPGGWEDTHWGSDFEDS